MTTTNDGPAVTDIWDEVIASDPAVRSRVEQHQRAARSQAEYERRYVNHAATAPGAVLAWRAMLSPHFEIETEVCGTHVSGAKLRIDMLLHPKFDWAGGGRYPIGFEIKQANHCDGTDGKAGDYLAQAHDYAATCWDSNIRSDVKLVYVCVSNIEISKPPRAQEYGKQGIGYLDLTRPTPWRFPQVELRIGNMPVWREREGNVGNLHFNGHRKFGSR